MGIPAFNEMNPAEGKAVRGMPESISVVVPAYNEEQVIHAFYLRTKTVLDSLAIPYEIVIVNDGSVDETWRIIREVAANDPTITAVNLSRNFGKEIALTAGLDAACGAVVVIIDADLQDPPEMMAELVSGWREGFDIVYAVRQERTGETWLKKATASAFYRVIQGLSRVHIPRDTGDFRLMSRRAVDALNQLREHHRFMKGLFWWVGYPAKPIYYSRSPRLAGTTKFNYWRLWNFALEGLTSFTVAPLKGATYLGLAVATVSFVYAAWVIYKTLAYGEPVQGYPSLMVVLLFIGGTQLICLGIIGEYLGRVFNEVKHRPLYLLDELRPSRIRAELRADCPPSQPANT